MSLTKMGISYLSARIKKSLPYINMKSSNMVLTSLDRSDNDKTSIHKVERP